MKRFDPVLSACLRLCRSAPRFVDMFWHAQSQQCTMGAMTENDQLVNDPCRAGETASAQRALGFLLLFVLMFAGASLALLSESYYVTLPGAALAYTASVMIYGFARNRGNPAY